MKENDIKSFSKIKFFNLLLEFLKFQSKSNYCLRDKINDIIERIKIDYIIEEDLLYKNPNSFGTVELKYYTLILLCYQYLFHEENNNNNDIADKLNEKDNDVNNSDVQNKNDIIKQVTYNLDDSIYINKFNKLKRECSNKNIKIKMVSIKSNFIL